MPHLHTDELNLYEMMQEVRKNLGESTASFWADIEIFNKLNQAQAHIARRAKCLKRTVTVTTVVDTQEYDLKDNSFADIIDISSDGVYFYVGGTSYHPLIFTTKKDLNNKFPGWQGASSSTPQYYYYEKATKTIGLYPIPNSTNAGDYLIISGYHTPKILLAGTASSGSSTSITFASGSSTVQYPSVTNDYYNNLWIEIYSGTGAGQKVEITDYVGSTVTATAAFTTDPDNTSIFGMVPQIPADAQGLMVLYALWKLWPKAGSRSSLGRVYKQDYYEGLSEFIGDFISDDDEEIEKESYRV